MKIAMCLEQHVNPKWHYAKQLGVSEGVMLGGPIPLWDIIEGGRVVRRYKDFGFEVHVVEGAMPMEQIKLDGEGAETELQQLITGIRNMPALGLNVLCYSWMAKISWLRTSFTTRARGGALTTSYDDALSQASVEFKGPPSVRAVDLWATLERFLERVLPICEQEGVMLAMHPDDPPLARVFGVERIMNSVAAFERLLALSPSKANGITLCQANFAAMNADVPATIRQLGRDGRIHFAHFRDIVGDAAHIVETFHDEGKTDMYRSMQAYYDIGYQGSMRPDHAPVMWGEPNENPGYEGLGRIFAIGYMRGLMEAIEKERGIRP